MSEKEKVMEEQSLQQDMTPVLLEDLGMKFATENSKKKTHWGLYKCQYCGNDFETMVASIKSGNTKSCGCYNLQLIKERNTSHNLCSHPLYDTWRNLKSRCYNPKNARYINYGARGIKVCERWLDINNFIEDVYPSYIKGLSLDRINNDGDYEPNNFRWTDRSTQQHNTQSLCKKNTSGFRGVSWDKSREKWASAIMVNTVKVRLGRYLTALEAGKAYERYVRLNNLEHNFTPALTEEEIEELKFNKTLSINII